MGAGEVGIVSHALTGTGIGFVSGHAFQACQNSAAKRPGFSRCARETHQRLKPDSSRARYGTPEGVP